MTGDAADMLARIRANLPPWFPNLGSAPVLDGALTGIATTLAFIYSLYAYAKLQTRISSATGAFLDLIAWDYFAGRFTRNPGEVDASFVARILQELIRQRVTRAAIQAAVEQLTGFPVRIIEPFALTDTGFWKMRGSGTPLTFYGVDTLLNPARWSSRIGGGVTNWDQPGATWDETGARWDQPTQSLRCQFFLECVLPLQNPFGNNAMPAWGRRGDGVTVYSANWMLRGTSGARAWGSSWLSRADTAANRGEQAVYSLISAMRAAGIICWVKFVPPSTALDWDQ